MNHETAIKILTAAGYTIIPPNDAPKSQQTGGYQVETTEGIFFMEGEAGEGDAIRKLYEAKGKTVKSVIFRPDGFFLN